MAGIQHAMGEVLRAERRRQQVTLKALAERAAISVPYLGEVERGKKYPSALVLERLAQALEIDVAAILELAALALRGEEPRRRIDAVGFALPVRGTGSPRALVDQIVDLLDPDDVTMLGEMGAFLAARRQLGRTHPIAEE
ncbi:MAG TPA: helix-turn-helix transcriptional regulator [Chloroflexota bacterium]|nr:helix-turn-helix transcriptional regulator [Chloroflexota bacterium]